MSEFSHTVAILQALKHEQRVRDAAIARLAANPQPRRPSLLARAMTAVERAATRGHARIWTERASPMAPTPPTRHTPATPYTAVDPSSSAT